jgi:hypothetical protein
MHQLWSNAAVRRALSKRPDGRLTLNDKVLALSLTCFPHAVHGSRGHSKARLANQCPEHFFVLDPHHQSWIPGALAQAGSFITHGNPAVPSTDDP